MLDINPDTIKNINFYFELLFDKFLSNLTLFKCIDSDEKDNTKAKLLGLLRNLCLSAMSRAKKLGFKLDKSEAQAKLETLGKLEEWGKTQEGTLCFSDLLFEVQVCKELI